MWNVGEGDMGGDRGVEVDSLQALELAEIFKCIGGSGSKVEVEDGGGMVVVEHGELCGREEVEGS